MATLDDIHFELCQWLTTHELTDLGVELALRGSAIDYQALDPDTAIISQRLDIDLAEAENLKRRLTLSFHFQDSPNVNLCLTDLYRANAKRQADDYLFNVNKQNHYCSIFSDLEKPELTLAIKELQLASGSRAMYDFIQAFTADCPEYALSACEAANSPTFSANFSHRSNYLN